MTEYSEVLSFGNLYFKFSSISASEEPTKLKITVGKTFIEKDIPMRDAKDTVLIVNGVIDGLSRVFGETESTAIERDRAALIALDDGTFHDWDDGRHVGSFVVVPGSLQWADGAERSLFQPHKFTMQIKTW